MNKTPGLTDWCGVVDTAASLSRVLLVFHGVLKVEESSRVRAHLRDGQFAGEMSLISGRPYSADVAAVETTRYLAWDRDVLEKLWNRYPKIRDVFEVIIGLDMAAKLGGHLSKPAT